MNARPPRKVRTEADVMRRHFASLSRARKANQMEDRRHAMRVEDELTSAANYELAMMDRERKRIQRELASLRLRSSKEAAEREAAVARGRMAMALKAQENANSTSQARTADFLIASGLLARKERKEKKVKRKEQARVMTDPSQARERLAKDPQDAEVAEWLHAKEEEVQEGEGEVDVLPQWEQHQLEADGKPRTVFTMPAFTDRLAEARKARYIRSQDPDVRERERELTTAEIFPAN